MPILEPLGDQGVLARCSDEAEAVRWANAVRRHAPPWLLDVVQAYTSVAVFHAPDQARVGDVREALEKLDVGEASVIEGKRHQVPCCYERALDLERIARHTGLEADAIITLHSQQTYVVHAIGFCPGFPYMGYLAPGLSGVPRLEAPRLRLEAGSVGLTGRQTGIYTEPRPGGWNVVGRTPLVLVDVADGYFPLRTGDQVRFYRIDEGEFQKLQGQRL